MENLNKELSNSDGMVEPTWNVHTLEHIYNFDKLANFDSRCFNIPKEEVSNYFLARQLDAIRNSVSMLGQSLYSHKELNNKNTAMIKIMCKDKAQDWEELHWSKKSGSLVIKEDNKWNIKETPLKFSYEFFKQILNLE